MKEKKTQQQVDGENILIWLAKQFAKGLLSIRSATVTEELGKKGGKRVVIFTQDKEDDK